MSSATQPRSWHDLHRVYLNYLYSLYHEDISWGRQLCDIGYQGFPDPVFKNSNNYTPDFLAIGESGDVQHIDVKGFEYIEKHFDGDEEQITAKIKAGISDLTKYQDITNEMVTNFLEFRGVSFEPTAHEIVSLVPYEIYNNYKSTVETATRDNDLILWIVKNGSEPHIWKAIGTHSNTHLNDELSSRISPYPVTDLIQYTRQTPTPKKIYKFTEKLVKFCGRERRRRFTFDEIDDIMIDIRPPLLGHLSEEEREKIWGDYIYYLLHQLDFIDHAEEENEYIWQRKRFITDSRDRHQILTRTKEKLDLK